MQQIIDDICRRAHLCIYCQEPWFKHIGRPKYCYERAWDVVRGKQKR